MKIRYLKLKNWMIVTLMGMLGLSSCRSQKEQTAVPDTRQRDKNHAIQALYGVREVPFEDKADTTKQRKTAVEEPCIYGVPTVTYRVSGRVTDSQGRPVEGIQVVLMGGGMGDGEINDNPKDYIRDMMRKSADTTAADGTYSVTLDDRPWEKQHLLARDIDGAKHGEYKSLSTDPIEFPEPKGGQGWNQGTTEQHVDLTIENR